MSVYQPGIPTGLVDLDQDYQNIQNNFQQLDTTFNVDHVTFSDPTAQNGYHKSLHMNPVSTTTTNAPNNNPINGYTATPGYGQVLSAQFNDGYNADEALFFLTGGGRLQQLTSNITPQNSGIGYTFLPGGLIFEWGLSAVAAVGAQTVITFPLEFSTAVYSVTFACINNIDLSPAENNIFIRGITKKEVIVTNSSSGNVTGVYWMAIGK